MDCCPHDAVAARGGTDAARDGSPRPRSPVARRQGAASSGGPRPCREWQLPRGTREDHHPDRVYDGHEGFGTLRLEGAQIYTSVAGGLLLLRRNLSSVRGRVVEHRPRLGERSRCADLRSSGLGGQHCE